MPSAAITPYGEAELALVFEQFRTESGRSLLELLDEGPALLIFLRHFGCAFCRQTLDQVSGLRSELAVRSVRPVFIHLGSPERAKPYFDYYLLSDVERVSDPGGALYGQPPFQLPKTNPFLHFLIPAVWKGWLKGAFAHYGIGMIREDSHQMPGVFFLRERKIVRSFRYRTIADEPDYLKLIAS